MCSPPCSLFSLSSSQRSEGVADSSLFNKTFKKYFQQKTKKKQSPSTLKIRSFSLLPGRMPVASLILKVRETKKLLVPISITFAIFHSCGFNISIKFLFDKLSFSQKNLIDKLIIKSNLFESRGIQINQELKENHEVYIISIHIPHQ